MMRESAAALFVVTDATLKYRHPPRLDGEPLVTTWVLEPGRACMTIGQQVRCGPIRIPTSIVKALS